jgi:hypothetical protein
MGIRRIVLVVLDGFRPETIDHCDLSTFRRLASGGAGTLRAEPVLPSVNTPVLFRDVAARVTSELGAAGTRFVGQDSRSILRAAQRTLSMQRRGLILMHWPDAERAGNDHGCASPQYHDAVRTLDASLGILAAHLEVPRDAGTLLIVVSDHGGGATSDQAIRGFLDRREFLVFAGGAVAPAPLPKTVSILDVAPTIFWALGMTGSEPAGIPLRRIFRSFREPPFIGGSQIPSITSETATVG